jgi:hypothetical protein
MLHICSYNAKIRMFSKIYIKMFETWEVLDVSLPVVMLYTFRCTQVSVSKVCNLLFCNIVATTLSFVNLLRKDGHCRPKHVGGVSCIYKAVVILLLRNFWNKY